ncbi:MAG: hypothetical protein WKF30_14380 [Pyrinomonadaceae bacterium]
MLCCFAVFTEDGWAAKGVLTGLLTGCLTITVLTGATLFAAGLGEALFGFFAEFVAALLDTAAVFDLVALRAGALSATPRLLIGLILADLPVNVLLFTADLAEGEAEEALVLREAGLFKPFVTGSLMRASTLK